MELGRILITLLLMTLASSETIDLSGLHIAVSRSPSVDPTHFGSVKNMLNNVQLPTHGNSVKGGNNLIGGSCNRLQGDHNQLVGKRNAVLGSENRVKGFRNAVAGNQNLLIG